MVSHLPIFQTQIRELSLLQTQWANQLNQILALPILAGVQLLNVSLISGVNVINHTLGRMQQGWFLTDVNAAATIYRSAPLNSQTLTLTSNAAVTASIWVY